MRNPRPKVNIYRPDLSKPDDPDIEAFEYKFKMGKTQMYIGSYTGFSVRKTGLILRQLEPKTFITSNTLSPSYYVTQSFDDRMLEFKRTDKIFLTEGLLDAEAFQQITGYPYVMAYLTSSVSTKLAQFLSLMCNEVIVIPDNDEYGKKNMQYTEKALTNFGVRCKFLEFNDVKDMGKSYFENSLHEGIITRAKIALM